jgi:parallel beta-helix repeat protein
MTGSKGKGVPAPGLRPLWLAAALSAVIAVGSVACTDRRAQEDPDVTVIPATPSTGPGETYSVGFNGFARIQSAVDAASPGDTVLIEPGTYRETVVLNKRLVLAPSGDGPVIIDAECSRAFGLEVNAGETRISGLQIHNANESGIQITEVSGVELRGMAIKDWNCAGVQDQHRAAVSCWYCSRLVVTDSHLETRQHWGNGIWVKSTNDRASEGGHHIARNTIIGGYDGIGSESENERWGGFVRNTVIEDNTIRNCYDDGIQVEGRNENVKVLKNEISRCGIGIAFAPNLVGPLYVEGNLIQNLRPGHYGNTECFKIGGGGSGVTYLTDNTCIIDGNGITETDRGASPIVSRGNCFDVTGYVFQFWNTPQGMDFDGDQLWSSDPSRFIDWGRGRAFGSLDEFRAQTGQERSGVEERGCNSL